MRIIAGKYRGKKLIEPKGYDVRPTSDRARESIFNILYSHLGSLEGKKVIDVFAGTGALGLEALSRGASKICFIDKDTKLLSSNVSLFFQEKDKIRIISSDVVRLQQTNEQYNLVFSDAPYDQGLNELAFEKLVRCHFLEDGAMCIVETRHNESLNLSSNFELIDERVYGMAKIWFYLFHV